MKLIMAKALVVVFGLGILGFGGYGLSQGKRPFKAVSMILIGGGIAFKGFLLDSLETEAE